MRVLQIITVTALLTVSANAGWVKEVIDDEDWSGMETSIVLDSSDYPHISYAYGWDGTTEFRYVYWDGTEWITDVVEHSDDFNAGGGL